jgi:hypothetical protein
VLEGEALHDRAAGATAIAYLGGPDARDFLVAAVKRASSRAERATLLRAIEELGD